MSVRVQRVYAFDPSPVTGYYDLDEAMREANSRGKRVYRIYEHGETLAYLRLAMNAFYPVAERDPESSNFASISPAATQLCSSRCPHWQRSYRGWQKGLGRHKRLTHAPH